MECNECGDEVEDEYAVVKQQGQGLDNCIDYGAGAQRVRVDPNKGYYHRGCLKEILVAKNQGEVMS